MTRMHTHHSNFDRRVLEAHVSAAYDRMMARPRGKRAEALKALTRLLRLLERAR